MKRGYIIVRLIVTLFLVFPSLLNAQNGDVKSSNTREPDVALPQSRLFQPGWHIRMGSSFLYSPLTGSMSGFSVSPVFTMPLTSRISLTGGAAINKFGSMPSPGGSLENSAGFVTLFGSASYQVNDKIVIYGTGVKHLGHLPYPLPYSQALTDQLTLGSELKLGDHLTIGASFRMNSNGNYLPDPWYDQYGPFRQWGAPFTPWP